MPFWPSLIASSPLDLTLRPLGRPGDPATAARLTPNDFYRLERALEIVRATGKPMDTFLPTDTDVPFDFRRA